MTLARVPTACRLGLQILLCFRLLGGGPIYAGDLGQLESTLSAHVAQLSSAPDYLVIRTRAGLRPRLRRRLFNQRGIKEISRIQALGATVLQVPPGQLNRIAEALRRSGYVKSVEPDYRAAATQAPNDPQFANQWGLRKIGIPAAWNVTLGSNAVIVAVVDTGIDASHPDLRDELVSGYDFVNDDSDPSDDNGHGTRMAGIIAAEAFNNLGIAGIAPGCKLMPVKVLDANGLGSYSTIAKGIVYAVDHGARVINLSVAGQAMSAGLQSAVDYATARGAAVVASAGNDGSGDPSYPAACTNAVAVSATDRNDSVAGFSNYGSWLTLAAPGVDILTTDWSDSGDAAYGASTGTSPAAAFVSGALALLFSARPDLSKTDAVDLLSQTARDLRSAGWDPYSGWGRINVSAALSAQPTATPAPAPPNGPKDQRAPTVSIVAPVRKALVYGDTSVDVAASDDVGVVLVELLADKLVIASDTAPPFGFTWDTTSVGPGKHTLRARAYDAAGHVKTSKAIPVQVTDGVGLFVQRARLAAPSRATGASTLSLTALLALPDDAVTDQPIPLAVILRSTKGSILSATMQLNAAQRRKRGKTRSSATAIAASSGVVEVRITRSAKAPTYKLSLSASNLSLLDADTIMSLTLTVNDATLSQSIPFRLTRGSFVFP